MNILKAMKKSISTVSLIIFILLPILSVELFRNMITQLDFSYKEFAFILTITLLPPLLSISIAIYEIFMCFRRKKAFRQGLYQIIIAYFTIILSFASFYYFENFIGDYNDAITKYYSYLYLNIEGNEERLENYLNNNEKLPTLRAFNNFNRRFFTSVDYMPKEKVYLIYEEPFTVDIIDNAQGHLDDIVQFIPEHRLPIYFDSLYYSIITLSTVGFGDIAPMQWYSKVAVSMQVIIGQFFLVLTIGFFFSTLNIPDEE